MGIIIATSESLRKEIEVQQIAPGVAPDFLWVMATARMVWPIKTPQHLRAVTGASIRTCKYWLAGEHVPSGRAAVTLLRALRKQLDARVRVLEQLELALGG